MQWFLETGSERAGLNPASGEAALAALADVDVLIVDVDPERERGVEFSTGELGVDGGNKREQVSRVRPGAIGSSRITNTWLGSTEKMTFGYSAMWRPLVASDSSRPSAAGSTSQSSRSSPLTGVVVWPQYMPRPGSGSGPPPG